MRGEYIPKAQLVDRAYYSGYCRNATVARWDASLGVFLHWRSKFGNRYLERIKHPEGEGFYEVFYPSKMLETVDEEIPM